MKIGIDASRYSHETATGVEWYSYHVINGLLKEVLGREDAEAVLYSRAPIAIPKEFEHPRKIREKVLPARRFWTLWKLSMEMSKDPPDVLFVPSHTLPLIRPKYSVITIHDTAFRYLRKSYSWLEYLHLNWSTKYAVKHASKIIVPSEATKEDLVRFFKCPIYKIVVVPHGFKKPRRGGENSAGGGEAGESEVSENLKNFGFGVASHGAGGGTPGVAGGRAPGIAKTPYVFFVGRLESKKNLARLVEAFALFSENRPEWKLVLAGKRGVGFEEILKRVGKLGIESKVIMPGYVDEAEKAYLYRNCEIFAFPSLYEGFGLPLLEAFSYGKPVLTSHVSCLPEVAGDAALYCDPFDTSELAHGLEKLANDKEFASKLAEKGSERLKEFSWERSVKKTFDVLVK